MSDSNDRKDDPTSRSLLDRLNALKGGAGTSITLDRPDIPLTGSANKPTSREDALADRLRSLRNTPDRDIAPPKPGIVAVPQAGLDADAPAAQPQSHSQSPLQKKARTELEEPDSIDSHLQTDDQTLADLLGDLSVDDQTPWGEADDAAVSESDGGRVEKLLEQLSRPLPPVGRKPVNPDDEHEGHSSDDSDGEHMTREVQDILNQAADGLKLDNDNAADQVASAEPDTGNTHPDAEAPGLSLPSVPSTLGATDHAKAKPARDFEHDMAARMAALRGSTSRRGEEGDDGDDSGGLGLPSVPTSLPAPKKTRASRDAKKLASRTGYTDADMETWCVACLDDGTLVCPGCDDDVFCSRCWHDMHRGPAAGYAERSHRPREFGTDGTRRKKVAVGAT